MQINLVPRTCFGKNKETKNLIIKHRWSFLVALVSSWGGAWGRLHITMASTEQRLDWQTTKLWSNTIFQRAGFNSCFGFKPRGWCKFTGGYRPVRTYSNSCAVYGILTLLMFVLEVAINMATCVVLFWRHLMAVDLASYLDAIVKN